MGFRPVGGYCPVLFVPISSAIICDPRCINLRYQAMYLTLPMHDSAITAILQKDRYVYRGGVQKEDAAENKTIKKLLSYSCKRLFSS